jgi:hypothetical protein
MALMEMTSTVSLSIDCFVGKFVASKRFPGNRPGRGENAQGDGQVESTAVFRWVHRRQTDRNPPNLLFDLGVLDRNAHAIARLLHRRFRQTDNRTAYAALN